MGPEEDKHQPNDGAESNNSSRQPLPESIELEVLEEIAVEEVAADAAVEPVPDKAAEAPAPAKAPPITVMDLIRAAPKPAEPVPAGDRTPEADRARLDAELKELGGLLRSTPALSFLKPRLAQLVGEGLDYNQLLSLYRIVARSFKDDLDKKVQMLKTMEDDFSKLQSKAEKMRSDMAGLQASARMAAAAEKAMAQLAPPEAPPPNLQAEMEKKDKDLAESNVRLERMQQDFQNYRSRAKVDIELSLARAREDWLRKILNVADNFERALGSSRDASAIDSLMKGIEMIQSQMMDVLASEGVKEIATVGEPFNPHFHDAFMHEETDQHPDETVIKTLTRGYLINGKVLRPAAVQISKMPAGKTYTPPGGKPAEAARPVREAADTLKRLPAPDEPQHVEKPVAKQDPEKTVAKPVEAKADPPTQVEPSPQQSHTDEVKPAEPEVKAAEPSGESPEAEGMGKPDPEPAPEAPAKEAPAQLANGAPAPPQEPSEEELEGWFADRMGKK